MAAVAPDRVSAAGHLQHQAELVEGPGLAEPVAKVPEHAHGPALVGGSGRVVPVSRRTQPS